MNIRRLPLLFAAFTAALTVVAAGGGVSAALIAPATALAPGSEFKIEMVLLNRSTTAVRIDIPVTIAGSLSQGQGTWPVELHALSAAGDLTISGSGFATCTYAVRLPVDASGPAVLVIDAPLAARAAIDIAADAKAQSDETLAGSTQPSMLLTTTELPAASRLQRTFANRFAFHEPIYFLYGPDAPAAKFQFSFRYRLLGRDRGPGDTEPPMRGVYFGYTQRSLWDIEASSSPFYDTSYMPELLFESLAPDRADNRGWFHWLGYHAGVKHESNGRGDDDSRSLNIAYIRPAVAIGRLDDWHLIVIPRVFSYLGTSSENPDIEKYRGYGELQLIVGKNDGLMIGATASAGEDGDKGSVQIDVTLPIEIPFVDFDTYMHLQYFNGYGESLRAYDRKSSTWRVGFSLVR